MKSKTMSKNPTKGSREMSFIAEALKLVESDGMREQTKKWLAHNEDRVEDRCTSIIAGAPIPLEQKLALLKQEPNWEIVSDSITEYEIQCINDAIMERYRCKKGIVNPAGTTFSVYLFDSPDVRSANTYDDAVEIIMQARSAKVDTSLETGRTGSHAYGKTDIVLKRVPKTSNNAAYNYYWFLDGNGDALYYDSMEYNDSSYMYTFADEKQDDVLRVSPCRLSFYAPFSQGDIVTADCIPFSSEKKVVILENADTVSSADSYGVTCLYINHHGNIDVGEFKSNEFLKYPKKCYVSPLYRSEVYSGELAEEESPLAVVSKIVKETPELGRKIFAALLNEKTSYCIYYRYINHCFDYPGVTWKYFKRKFAVE